MNIKLEMKNIPRLKTWKFNFVTLWKQFRSQNFLPCNFAAPHHVAFKHSTTPKLNGYLSYEIPKDGKQYATYQYQKQKQKYYRTSNWDVENWKMKMCKLKTKEIAQHHQHCIINSIVNVNMWFSIECLVDLREMLLFWPSVSQYFQQMMQHNYD